MSIIFLTSLINI